MAPPIISTTHPSASKPFLAGLEVLSISPTQIRIRNIVISRCYDQTGATTNIVYAASTALPMAGPYTFSDTVNKLTVIGCDDSAQFWGYSQAGTLTTSCGSMCSNSTVEMIDEFDGNCTGIGCCQTDIPKGLKVYEVLLSSFQNHTQVWLFNKCGYAFMGEQDGFHFRSDLSNISDPNFMNQVPIVLNFAIGSQSCVEAQNLHICAC
ncbi:hypothetical protein RHMOL_Rhmol04G0096000 [Rhododendron molle]|uniref:Uncharacterized protein n=1 Tax=Rhododendron molle TaxID=49168 RepID=A0ACC0NZ09_RHOML|nr:hypothetical protein RHMOL_Rhmol04G0096000 [Rhododendron molle]